MLGTVVSAVLYATTWVDNRIITHQTAAQEAVVQTLQASLAEMRGAIVSELGARIGTAETNLRAEIQTVEDRVHTHVANHPSQLLDLSGILPGAADPTRRVGPDQILAILEGRRP